MAVKIGVTQALNLSLTACAESKRSSILMGYLRIAGLIGAYQPQSVAAQDWSQPIGKKEDRESKKENRFADTGPGGIRQRRVSGEPGSGGSKNGSR